MKQTLTKAIEARWYGKPGWLLLLWPLSAIFRLLAWLRRHYQVARQERLAVPVIIVGNIAVGGTGKTPLLIALAKQLQHMGYSPGILSRGYGTALTAVDIHWVNAASNSALVGDEPVLIAKNTGCPVVVCRDRVAAARGLIARDGCDVLLSDDGLQHYRLARHMEIAVVDGSRGFGNGYCLPTGPLREPKKRLRQVDWVLCNGPSGRQELEAWAPVSMNLQPQVWRHVKTDQAVALGAADWLNQRVYAIAGIGNPQRFFDSLTELGLSFDNRAFADHHPYHQEDFAAFGDNVVVMTAKDAVKCRDFARENWWYLDVAATLPDSYLQEFTARVQAMLAASKARDD